MWSNFSLVFGVCMQGALGIRVVSVYMYIYI